MLTTASWSGNSNRWGTCASRSFGPISGSVLMIMNTLSMTSLNSRAELNSVMAASLSGGPAQHRRCGRRGVFGEPRLGERVRAAGHDALHLRDRGRPQLALDDGVGAGRHLAELARHRNRPFQHLVRRDQLVE